MTDLTQAKQYLARVLPWPQEGEAPAFGNVHWKFHPEKGEIKKDAKGNLLLPWHGRAVHDVAGALRALEYAQKNTTTRDIYLCLSTQQTAIEKTSAAKNWTYHVPVRSQENAVALKSLFIDVDLKGGDHGYDTPQELVTALGNFIKAVNLPTPSVMVASGGGYHIYWTLARALSPDEWKPLAYALAEATKQHSLKCDQQVTIDSARVLRIPGTLNYKTDPPRPVTLVGTPNDFDYSVERLSSALEPYKVALPKLASTAVEDMALFTRRAPVSNDLGAGIEVREFPPIDIATVVPGCGFLREALATGGKDFTNPLWNLTTLTATFCDDGRKLAHLMGRKHPGYSVQSTDDLFERKARERDEKGIGWPACRTISATGAKACSTCPHLQLGKTPLHLGRPVVMVGPAPAVQATTPIAPGPPPNAILPSLPQQVTNADLPAGYVRSPSGLICVLVMNDAGVTTQIPICQYPMVNPWLQKKPWELHFTTITDEPQQIALPCEVVGSNEMRKTLQNQGLMLHDGTAKQVTEFLVSWVEKLKATKSAVVSTAPFGWNIKGGKIEGFVFGGSVWSPTGPRAAPSPDPVTANQYMPSGDVAPWSAAAKLITDQGRPALDAIVASAFAAPLVRFTGQTGLLMSVYSEESGIGKTTALKVAQAVWGDPVRAMQGLSDTQNSVIGKIGEIRSLPLYWDELKTEDDTKRFVNLVFQLTLGKEKSRMTSRVQQRAVGTWQTLLVSASNESLLDYVTSRTKMTTAGLYRVFEYQVPPGKNGQIAPADAQRMIAALNDNYGQVGLSYATFLGSNFGRVDKEVGDYLKAIEGEVDAKPDERFWSALVATICMGARYANELGYAVIGEEALKRFMVGVLDEMRSERLSQPVDMKNVMNVSNVLSQFLNAMRSRHTLITNFIHLTKGKPPPNSVQVLSDASRLDGIYVHVGQSSKIVRISSTSLSDWLTDKGYSRHLFTKALEAEFGVRSVRGRIGSGTQYAGGTEYLLEIDLAGNPLLNFLDEA